MFFVLYYTLFLFKKKLKFKGKNIYIKNYLQHETTWNPHESTWNPMKPHEVRMKPKSNHMKSVWNRMKCIWIHMKPHEIHMKPHEIHMKPHEIRMKPHEWNRMNPRWNRTNPAWHIFELIFILPVQKDSPVFFNCNCLSRIFLIFLTSCTFDISSLIVKFVLKEIIYCFLFFIIHIFFFQNCPSKAL